MFVTAIMCCCLVEVRRVGVGAVVLVSGLVFRGICLDGMTFAKEVTITHEICTAKVRLFSRRKKGVRSEMQVAKELSCRIAGAVGLSVIA